MLPQLFYRGQMLIKLIKAIIMTNDTTLNRFIEAQTLNYADALAEIKNGKKRTHWMWYIFPQIQGLGFSEFARFYAIKDLTEAEAYLKHPILGTRLLDISRALLTLAGNDPYPIFGSPDDMKLHSSMTLFAHTPGADPVFQQVLDKFYNGRQDLKTMKILNP